PALRRVARSYRELSLPAIASLLRSSWHEERLLALLILVRQYPDATPAQRDAICRLYMRRIRHINNWDLVDCSAGIVGAHLSEGRRSRLRRLARSQSVWERRLAIIATYFYIRRGEFDDTLQIATLLLNDPHDLIHKAVGWMLREVGKRNRAVEVKFLRKHVRRMPRTMLRYAVERFPARLRRQFLSARSL